jgi:hypothetical protein
MAAERQAAGETEKSYQKLTRLHSLAHFLSDTGTDNEKQGGITDLDNTVE